MEWTKEKLIETLKYIIQSSESKEIAFEETDKLFYNVLSRDDLVNILIDFIAEDDPQYQLFDDECSGYCGV